ncbi:right-handed parallel beta-helix repeat-containing protein [uncultured Methanobrevibacter sp.]|uniref:right-handed parallel beta-helix repeat-containing protein n=1 Tax=uncultured Methanobrevibacter sp. TaxID=253161 RepID=UPI0025E71E78|nr:right-handed parallel beta-helix repeat-containing protein [uncultured Methanobrevibacter sp.]
MYYVVPRDMSASGICAEYRKNVKLNNNTIYFEAHNDYNGSDYAIKLERCYNAIIDNNTLVSSFPLRLINFETGGVNHVAGICMEYCDNFQLTNNNLTVDVNKRPLSAYPTLVAVRIVGSNNGIVKNNDLSMEDFVTSIGSANYLYGIDVHTLRNLSVDSNNISIRTQGGILAAGTAYGIQLTGPLDEIRITNNDIYSISNGPNLGIYSQNYFGDTALDISNNTINITGLAGKHEWALVAGIEVQDSNDNIKNNIIEVHSVGAVDEEDNLYGISYRQNTDGDHTFKIEDNLVFSEGYYAVYLLSSVDSTIKNNMLVTSREGAPDKTLEGYKEGPKEHIGSTFYNNTVVNEYTYWSKILNTIDGGEDTTYKTPENVNNRDNTVDGKFVDPDNNKENPNYNTNPVKPGNGTKPVKPTYVDPEKDNPAKHGSEDGDGDGMNDFTNSTTKGGVDDYTNSSSKKELDDYTNPEKNKSKDDYTKTSTSENVDLTDKEVKDNWEDYTNHDTNSDSDWKDYTKKQADSQKQSTDGTFVDNSDKPQDNGISLPDSKVPSNMTSNTEGGQVISNSNNGEVIATNSTTPSATGESAKSKEKTSESSNSETSSPSASGAVSPSKAYEVTKSITDHPQATNMLIPIALGLVILALLIFGYRRKSDYEDY